MPYDKGNFSHKMNYSAVKYKITIDIYTSKIPNVTYKPAFANFKARICRKHGLFNRHIQTFRFLSDTCCQSNKKHIHMFEAVCRIVQMQKWLISSTCFMLNRMYVCMYVCSSRNYKHKVTFLIVLFLYLIHGYMCTYVPWNHRLTDSQNYRTTESQIIYNLRPICNWNLWICDSVNLWICDSLEFCVIRVYESVMGICDSVIVSEFINKKFFSSHCQGIKCNICFIDVQSMYVQSTYNTSTTKCRFGSLNKFNYCQKQ